MRNVRRRTMQKQMVPHAGAGRDKKGAAMFVWFVAANIFMALSLIFIVRIQAEAGRMKEQIAHISCGLTLVQEKLGLPEGESDSLSGENGQGGGTAGSMGFRDSQERTGGSGEIEFLAEGVIGADSYAALWGLEEVDRPIKRNAEQVLQQLKKLGEENELIAAIYEKHSAYPDKLLEALANNPEMAGFVSGYQGNSRQASGGLTEEELAMDFPLFLQWDPRWGYVEYGDKSCIGLAGCGPTCLSMALFYLTKNDSLTPDKIAAYSMTNGYYVSGTGTAWALLADLPSEYGVRVTEPGRSEQGMKQALDRGEVIICSMGPGDFTAAGHFIVIYGYDEEGFMINDPNCVARSMKRWTYGEIAAQIKHIWVLGGEAVTDGSVVYVEKRG